MESAKKEVEIQLIAKFHNEILSESEIELCIKKIKKSSKKDDIF